MRISAISTLLASLQLAALMAAGGLAAGCGAATIPNTDIEDTRPNREIIAVCERYRKAIAAHFALT